MVITVMQPSSSSSPPGTLKRVCSVNLLWLGARPGAGYGIDTEVLRVDDVCLVLSVGRDVDDAYVFVSRLHRCGWVKLRYLCDIT